MIETMNEKEIMNHKNFMNDLEKLTKKYGIAIQACGCFIHFDLNNEKDGKKLENFKYIKDYSSGDIMNNLYEIEEADNN